MTTGSPGGARRFGRTLRIAAALALASSCGGDTTGPPPSVPALIAIEPKVLTFSWVGESHRLLAEVRDEAGTVLADPALSWSSTNPSAVTVSPGGVAVAAGTGQATITASSGRATGSASATVSLVPRSMLKVSGDAQRGRAGSPLSASLVTEVRDVGGTPIPGAAVAWTISGGDGVITSSLDQTDGAGRASARWTLGEAEGSQAVTARAGTVNIVFTAEAIPPLEAAMSPPSARIQVADSADFALAISGGDPDETASWTCTSPDTGVVYVQPTAIGCRATGLAEGNATVSATVARGADRVTAAAALEVGELVGAVRITGIEPAVLIEGQDATIHGTGFSAVASENRVTIGGLAARVSAAAETRLTLTVPRAECLPPRQTLLLVSNSSTTASRSAGITPPPEDVDLPVGWFRYTAAGTGCLHLPGSAAGGEYLIGVASTSELPSSLTPVSLSGTPGDPSVAATSPAAVARPGAGTGSVSSRARIAGGAGAPPPPGRLEALAPLQEWTTGRREAEARLRAGAKAELALLGRPRAPAPQTRSPARMAPGERVTLWVAPGGSCTPGTQVQAVVRFIGTHTVWLEDLANPSGTFSDAEFEGLDTFYASRVEPVHDRYFGELSDVDLNGRILVLLTQEVNKVVGLGGYVTPTDLYPTTQCATSNHAEIFYVSAPNLGGADGGGPTSTSVLAGYRNLLVHEITHLVQANAYVLGGSGEKTIWEIEGGATLAEQLVAYDLFGHGSGRNLGHAQVHQTEESRAWYWGGWIADMASFFGWDGFGAGSGRVRGAPEECTWIGTEEDGNTGPCAGGQVYGVPSMLLRFVMDRWGEEYPGGEAALMRRLVNSPSAGFSSLEEVSGSGIEQILAEFYIALWGDGRPSSPGSAWDWMASWDLHDIFSRFPDDYQLQPRNSSSQSLREDANIRGGSSLYVHWSPSGSLAPTSIRVTAPSGASVPGHVSVWAWRIR